VKPMKWS